MDREWLAVVCAAAVVFGHVYPVWYEFRGGKGAATLIGAVAVLAPMALVPVLLVWLATVLLTGYVGLGTMLGTATLPLYFAYVAPRSTPLVVFGLVMAAFVVFTHRSNVQRMRDGHRESRAPSLAAAAAMSASAERLVRLLADGEMHSGERLAADLGVTRAAVWKIVAELRERGVAVASHERRGYQLEQSVELLDLQSLRRSAAVAGIELPGGQRSVLRTRVDQRVPACCRGTSAHGAAPRVRRTADGGTRAARSRVARAVRIRAHVLDRLDVCGDAGGPVGARSRAGRLRRARAARTRCGGRAAEVAQRHRASTTPSSAACCCRCAPKRAGRRTWSPDWA